MIPYFVWWILLVRALRVLADEKLLKKKRSDNGEISLLVLLFCSSCGASVTGSCSSSRFSWFLRNREHLTTTFRRRRGIISSRRRRARTKKRRAHLLFSSSATKRFQLALCGEQREMRTAMTDEMREGL